MLCTGQGLLPAPRLDLSVTRQEVENAMRATTETLSQVTNLLAVVSAPSANTATIRHVEVLALQPRMVMVVIITSTGGVSKVLTTLEGPVDPGLLSWAGEYLNERLTGLSLGARMLHQRPRARHRRAWRGRRGHPLRRGDLAPVLGWPPG
jgi:heat-inducible transcriptional repressor